MSTELPGLSTMNLKMDIIHFQDETLKNMRQMQSKLDDKYAKSEELLNEKITKFDLKIKSLEQKITELSTLIIKDNALKEKFESLFNFKEEMQDTLFKRRAKFSELEKKVNDNIDEINKILTNTVIYPRVIGKTAKFQTFHEFIDYVILEISQLNIFKNKSQIDLITPFKKKIEGIIETFKIQINNLTPKEVTNQLINDLEQKMDSTFKLYDEKLQDTRVENANYSINIQKKVKEMNKQINDLIKKQNYMNKKLEKIQKFEFLNILSNEIIDIHEKINKAFIILKDLTSFHPEVKNNYKIDFDKKSSKKIISIVKEYIKGFISVDELSSNKKFLYKKSKTKVFDLFSSNQKLAQNTSPENSINNYFSQKKQNNFFDSKFKSNNIIEGNNNDNNNIINNINKKFLRKKTANISLQENAITNKLEEPAKFQRNMPNKKNTISFRKNAYLESSKINNYLMKSNNNDDFLKKQSGEKISNFIIEEENEVNNNSNISDNDNKYITSKKNKINKPQLSTYKNNNIEIKNQNNIKINDNTKTIDSNEDETKKTINLNIFTNSNRELKGKKKEIKSYLINESGHFINNTNNKKNQDLIRNDFSKNEKPYKLHLKNNNSQESIGSQTEIKNNINNTNNNNKILRANQTLNSDISISPLKTKLYKTFSSFPRINHDNNDLSLPTKNRNYTKYLNLDDFYKKKVLMLNVNGSPLDNFHKTFTNMFRINLKRNVNKSVRITKSKKNDINNLKFFGKNDINNDKKI